ncbi:MAG: ABC transporter permease, partial [Ruthenibacterium sp.]
MIDKKSKRFSDKQMMIFYTFASVFCLLAVWEIVARFTKASMFLPPASEVILAFCKSFVVPIGKRTML